MIFWLLFFALYLFICMFFLYNSLIFAQRFHRGFMFHLCSLSSQSGEFQGSSFPCVMAKGLSLTSGLKLLIQPNSLYKKKRNCPSTPFQLILFHPISLYPCQPHLVSSLIVSMCLIQVSWLIWGLIHVIPQTPGFNVYSQSIGVVYL